jgi:hypothetical protein
MTLTDTYTGDAYEGQAVDVAVVAADGTPISEVLYHLGAPAPLQTIRFLGGPGFTGLQQMNHCRARLQVSCFAEWWLCSANPLRAWAGARVVSDQHEVVVGESRCQDLDVRGEEVRGIAVAVLDARQLNGLGVGQCPHPRGCAAVVAVEITGRDGGPRFGALRQDCRELRALPVVGRAGGVGRRASVARYPPR